MIKKAFRNPWYWVPSLYLAEGLPYVVVMTVSVIMYKRLNLSNTEIALYTSWLYLPWVIKPLWSPVVDLLKTKRFWIVTMQLVIGAGLGGVAFTIPVSNFFQYTLAFFWLLAFSSATHDIAADGFYMLGLSKHDQALFVGIRSTFYRVAMITGQGLLIILAGYIESNTGLAPIEVNVKTTTDSAHVQFIHPDELNIPEGKGQLRIITFPSGIEIGMQNQTKESIDSILKYVRERNTISGFYASENERTSTDEDKSEPSWFRQNVIIKLENFLRDNFGPQVEPSKSTGITGNIGIVYFQLSQKPDEDNEVILNFGRETGDKSISLIEGTRFTFNSKNWNKIAMAVIQLDPKLNYSATATFIGRSGDIPLAWMITFVILAGLFVLFFIYHKFNLPYPLSDKPTTEGKSTGIRKEFFKTFILFFKQKRIGFILGFILLYRFAEAQLVKLASPFLLDWQEVGGLALTTGEVGFVYGTVGIIFLTLGGILGGFLAARHGLKYWIWWMILAINLPDLVYVYLSYTQTTNFLIINIMVAIEQFGYGFGFTAFILYLIFISEGKFKTSHYAIATGLMALGMMIPGMFSGWLQELIGYQHFFIWVIISTIPVFLITKFIPLDSEFGKIKESVNE